jgi:hypothetical protein
MNRLLTAALAALLVLAGTGCDTNVTPETPHVMSQAVDGGGALRLSWEEVTGAKSYEIKTDASTFEIDSTSYAVSTPTATIEVRAVSGSNKSDSASVIDCRIVETTIEVSGYLNPDSMESGFGFDADGIAVAYTLDLPNFPSLDYWLDDGDTSLSPVGLVNPGRDKEKWNNKGNKIKGPISVDYDSVEVADAPGSSYVEQLRLAAGVVYYLWLDPTKDGWSTDDHFAKANVVSMDGSKVTLKIGYQKVKGIRWLVK